MKIMGVKESKGTYEGYDYYNFKLHCLEPIEPTKGQGHVNTPPETVPLDRTNGALRPLKWCMVTAVMVH